MNELRSAKNIFKTINLVYKAFFLGMIVFLVTASLLVSNAGGIIEDDPLMAQTLKIIAIGMAVVLIPVAYSIPQKLIRKISKELSLEEKLTRYQSALIIRFALTEGLGILATIFFLLTADNDFLMLFAIILLFYIISRPTPFKAATDLELSEIEKHELM
jgi:O-antigen/teichoic acid export membrane protein